MKLHCATHINVWQHCAKPDMFRWEILSVATETLSNYTRFQTFAHLTNIISSRAGLHRVCRAFLWLAACNTCSFKKTWYRVEKWKGGIECKDLSQLKVGFFCLKAMLPCWRKCVRSTTLKMQVFSYNNCTLLLKGQLFWSVKIRVCVDLKTKKSSVAIV